MRLQSLTASLLGVTAFALMLALPAGEAFAKEEGGHSLVSFFSIFVLAKLLGFAALIMASVNIFGGFLVTQRMLGMYQKKK